MVYLQLQGNQDKNRKLVYVMRVDEIDRLMNIGVTTRFLKNRPAFNASKAQICGDNIYHQENGVWIQEKSHHSQFVNGKYHQCKLNTENRYKC